jgi:nucleoside-diphosphate-sugar epimerase
VSRVAVAGSSGFVGASVVRALQADGHEVVAIRAPRIRSNSRSEAEVIVEANLLLSRHEELVANLKDVDAVINAAGIANAASTDRTALIGANAVIPTMIQSVLVRQSRPPRFVHVSSAAVQGWAAELDESRVTKPVSPYSWSKSLGERVLAECENVVSYRPTSVHGLARPVTRSVARLARSPLSSVAGTGDAPTPQVLVQNVGAAAAFLALVPEEPPAQVLHPWEGLTTAAFLHLLGGREPMRVPMAVARRAILTGRRIGAFAPRAMAASRRIEVLWFGQKQAMGWLSTLGWTPTAGLDEWADLASALAHNAGGKQ